MRLANIPPQKAILAASLLLYLSSLLFPAVEYDAMSSRPQPAAAVATGHLWHDPVGQVQKAPGYFHLVYGWVGMLLPPQFTPLGWLANPAFFLALLAVRWGKAALARALAVCALILAASSLVVVNLTPMRVLLHDPQTQFWSAIRPLTGYWLWLAAIAALNVYAFWVPSATRSPGSAPLVGGSKN
jgi:hypothetical protein